MNEKNTFIPINLKNKGFTLVELLAVIIIMAIILLIVVPKVTSVIAKTKTNSYNIQIRKIEDAGEKYVLGESVNLVEGLNEITLRQLINRNYLDNKIIDPRCNCEMDLDASKVIIIKMGDVVTYGSNIESGYIGETVTINPVIIASIAERTSSTITLNIVDIQGDIDKYKYKLNNGNWQDLPASKIITGLTSASEYEIKIKAISGSIESAEVVNTIKTLYADNIIVGNDPLIPTGAIPITRNNENNAWVVADLEDEWYNYANSKWANMVLVTEASRNDNKYIDVNGNFIADVIVSETDVLAYYVWIPRYKYTIFSNKTTSSPVLPSGGIEIEFIAPETTNRCSDSDDCVIGDKLVHPAFRFGNEEIKGIWVGKFELTSDADSCDNNDTCLEEIPTVKPNIPSLRRLNVSELASKIDTFKTNSMYGINININTDSHMMKNMEWGAVAYLSASIYGRTTSPIWNNSDSTYLTGRIGSSANAGAEETNNTTTYDDSPTASEGSTTRNIYGIYDMSGGSYEYVMGVMKDNTSDNPMSGDNNFMNSGYSGKVYNDGAFTDFTGIPFPSPNINNKYYDLYAFGTVPVGLESRARGRFGDATFETQWINTDSPYFVTMENPWFGRGDSNSGAASAGIFSFTCYSGNFNINYTTRAVLVKW